MAVLAIGVGSYGLFYLIGYVWGFIGEKMGLYERPAPMRKSMLAVLLMFISSLVIGGAAYYLLALCESLAAHQGK